mgnify:CR=1 FL=1
MKVYSIIKINFDEFQVCKSVQRGFFSLQQQQQEQDFGQLILNREREREYNKLSCKFNLFFRLRAIESRLARNICSNNLNISGRSNRKPYTVYLF